MKQETLIAYSMSAASYLIENVSGIRNIILFGSVARGKFDSQSDIDIFVDIPTISKKKEKEVTDSLENFKKTEAFEKWQLKGIKSEIVLVIGDLKSAEWESLYLSICSEGLALYGKYKSLPANQKHNVIFSYGPINNEKKRVNIYRKLFGYKSGKKQYAGLVSKFNGKKIGPNVFIVPVEDSKRIRDFFEKMRVTLQLIEAWM